MGLNKKYQDGFIAQIDASQRGEVVKIEFPLDRVNEVFNIMPSRYTLITGATGSGKTSFMDFGYILGPWSMMQKQQMDIHWEVVYFSLERKQMFKHAKWVSWMIYRDNANMLLSSDQIMGWKNGPLNSEGYKLVRSYDDEMSELLEHVRIYDGKVNAKVIKRIVKQRAIDLGTFFKSDDVGIMMDDQLVYLERFSDKGLSEVINKADCPYIDLEWEGNNFRLYQDDHKYFPKHPRTFVFIAIDGINLLGTKEELDDISTTLSDARDMFGFSPIVVSQQNRAMGDIARMKTHGADLSPQIEDAFKSSQMGFDCDIMIGLFDPYTYKAWDKEGNYGGYCINPMGNLSAPSMLTPGGINRFRSIHILKNTFGPKGNKFGLKFLGECNHFETLPFPDDINIEKMYSDIRKGI
jgi:hypothetical protein